MAECAMASFLNGQYYQSVCCTAALVYMGEQLRSHERHLMCDIFLGIINKFIIEKIELEKQLEAKRQALQQISEPTEEQKQVVEAAKEGINILLWHLTMYISEMLVITIEALNYFTTDDHEPKVFLYRLMGECLGIMCQLVNTDDDVVNTAASIAYAFGMVYGFHLPPTHPSNLDNIISYCIFSVRNLRNLDAAIQGDRFLPVMREFHTQASVRFAELEDKFQDMKTGFDRVVRLFGEDGSVLQADELFGIFDSLMGAFAEARHDNESFRRRQEEKEKRAKQEVELKKRTIDRKNKTGLMSSVARNLGLKSSSPTNGGDLISALRTGDVFGENMA
ncbi:blast:Disheveled-associated activator of morphogenesis 2, partial [Drosophila guanche]